MATPADLGGPHDTGPGSFNARVIGVWLGLLILVGLVFAAWHSGGSRLRDDGAIGPWIGLPPGGTDITDWSTRQILQQLQAEGRPASALASGCGHDPGWGSETYVATLADTRDGSNAWRVVFEVQGEQIVVRAWRSDGASSNGRPDIVRSLSRAQLAEVRDAWRVHSLWGDDNGDALGRGSATRLETCIDGHYGIRQQPHNEMGERLYAAVARALALPPRDVSGR